MVGPAGGERGGSQYVTDTYHIMQRTYHITQRTYHITQRTYQRITCSSPSCTPHTIHRLAVGTPRPSPMSCAWSTVRLRPADASSDPTDKCSDPTDTLSERPTNSPSCGSSLPSRRHVSGSCSGECDEVAHCKTETRVPKAGGG
jgi:hypothetical protein